MSRRSLAFWTVAAIAGLLVAAGVTLAASKLSSQRIGLSSEPLSAGDELAAPASTRTTTPTPTPKPRRTATPKPTRTPSGSGGEDKGGSSGSSSGGGSDDSGGPGGGIDD